MFCWPCWRCQHDFWTFLTSAFVGHILVDLLLRLFNNWAAVYAIVKES